MITTKKNVTVYTIVIDNKKLDCPCSNAFELIEPVELFKKEFEKEGLEKESARIEKGGFSYRQVAKDRYYTIFEVSITTRTKWI